MKEKINAKMVKAAKWSGITEFITKIIQPVTNMILARILSPEAFGLMAVITMVISFANLFSESGFVKFLIQHEFESEKEKEESAQVVFWTNLGVSAGLWMIIGIFRNYIAGVLGHPNLSMAIVAAGSCVPLTSVTAVQTALYQRNFNFKILFLARITGAFIPVFVTIPLALLGFHYWALIIGTICGNLWNALILTVKSQWKIRFFYRYSLLKKMMGFSAWSWIDALSVWITAWIDVAVIGNAYNDYYLGLYTNSINNVNAFLNVITAATGPILLSALSRLQNNENEYRRVFFHFQGLVSLLLIPMGTGLFLFRDLATRILFGSQWEEAALLVGLWGFISTFLIVFSDYSSIIFVSKGKPQISFISQILYLSIYIPALVISARYSFQILIYTRVFIRLAGMLINLFFLNLYFQINSRKMVKNVYPAITGSFVMAGWGLLLRKLNNTVPWMFLSIFLCMTVYFIVIFQIGVSRKYLWDLAGWFPFGKNKHISFPAKKVEN